jgi:hypothetical protein
MLVRKALLPPSKAVLLPSRRVHVGSPVSEWRESSCHQADESLTRAVNLVEGGNGHFCPKRNDGSIALWSIREKGLQMGINYSERESLEIAGNFEEIYDIEVFNYKDIDSLAVDAVYSEPFSGPDSLLTGKNRGKIANSAYAFDQKISAWCSNYVSS